MLDACGHEGSKGAGPTYPEPGVIQLPATAHLLGSNGECLTTICDTGAPTAEWPTLQPGRRNGSPRGSMLNLQRAQRLQQAASGFQLETIKVKSASLRPQRSMN